MSLHSKDSDVTLAEVIAATNIAPAFSAGDKSTIQNVLTTDFTKSATARAMLQKWVNAGKTIAFQQGDGSGKQVFQALTSKGVVQINMPYITGLSYIDDTGRAILHTPLSAITHELGHALGGYLDNYNVAANYYEGDNVHFVNQIFAELGIPKEISYIGQGFPNMLKANYDYTAGHAVTGALVSDKTAVTILGFTLYNEFSTGSTDDLLVGGPSDNTELAGAGNDFLFGAGGNDTLNGGDGIDTAVYYGSPLDYDVREAADGKSWTVRNPRGTENAGTDTLINVEKIQFDGVTFDLKKGGLKFQTDFALVIDTTGSMGSSIGAVKSNATALINAAFTNADARIGIVGFKDTTNGEPSSVILPFTDNDSFAARKTAALNAINSITVGGGGDLPETLYDGLRLALTSGGAIGTWRGSAGKLQLTYFTDATAKDASLKSTVDALARKIGGVAVASGAMAAAYGAVDEIDLEAPTAALIDELYGDAPITIPYDMSLNTPASVDTSTTTVQIFGVVVGGDSIDTSTLSSVVASNGGRLLTAPTDDALVSTLLSIINAPPSATGSLTVTATADYRNTAFTTVSTIAFATTATATTSALFNASEFSAAKIATNVAITGDAHPEQIGIIVDGTSFSAASFTFTNWTGGQDFVILYGGDAGSALTGSSRDDAILAGSGSDTINAGAGDNYINAGNGNDVILAGNGADIVYGGAGNDYVNAGGGADIVLAGAGNDTIFGGAGRQILFGEAGNDVIFTGAGDTFAAGGDGNDKIYGASGNQYLLGGAGDDLIVAGGAGANVLVGGAGNDDLRGGAGSDALFAGDGDDYLTGGGGSDYFYVFDQGAVAYDQKFIVDWDAGGAADYVVLPAALQGAVQFFDQGGYAWIAAPADYGFDFAAVAGTSAAVVQSRVIWQ